MAPPLRPRSRALPALAALALATLAAPVASQPAARSAAPQEAAAQHPASLPAELPAGFTSLFNGRDLTGWRGRPHLDPAVEAAWSEEERAAKQAEWDASVAAHWSVDGGELVNDGQGAYLTTREHFGDFELLLDYKTVAKADSGIYLRANPQVQIWDTTEAGGKWNIGADRGSGGLWNNQTHTRMPLTHADRPFGEWNELRILMVGEKVSVWLNGEQTVDWTTMENYFDRTRPVAARGPIQLQTHGGEIRFRKLAVRRISADEANWMLSSRDAAGFRSVFNGLDLTGWAGATDHYEVVEGAVRCKAGHGGNLYTEAVWADFQARLEFRLPPGGNNGLAIRYPGQGNPAYDGMCELQVLDNTAEKYASLKPYQYHGSVYGQFPAHRGYLRAPGAWNFQQVTVIGTRITVELNGFTILDADVAAVDTPADGQEHPGRMRPEGHFGFCGHNDPVAFREIRIRRLAD